MRTASCCTVEQALTPEASTVLKLSISLAKRRGHAQVTPLHVASTLLSSAGNNFLRRACIRSHPHRRLSSSPSLNCRALDLCFNVALNRLPSSPPPSHSSSAISITTASQQFPSLSNALVAALKRAQAHQRRGSIEFHNSTHLYQQQQSTPVIAVKVELEQLVISILDDPSVSRVMKEGGFCSTAVKQYIEEDYSIFECYSSSSSNLNLSSSSLVHTQLSKSCTETNSDDIKVVVDVMLRKNGRSNTVIVDDSSNGEIVADLIRRVERGEVTEELKNTQFIKVQLSSLHIKFMSRVEVDHKVSELSARIKTVAEEKGKNWSIVVYVGDLKWAVVEEEDEECRDGFKPVEHLITQIGRMLEEFRDVAAAGERKGPAKVWIMATANYQTYMRCQMIYPQLEKQWCLQAVVVPSAGLSLALQSPSGLVSRVAKVSQNPFQVHEQKGFHLKEDEHQKMKPTMCDECSLHYEKEASFFEPSPNLPSWLQPHNLHKENLNELKRKWSRLCGLLHYNHHMQIGAFPSVFNQVIVDYRLLSSSKISMNEHVKNQGYRDVSTQQDFVSDIKTTLALGSSLISDSATSKDQAEGLADASNRKRLCDQLARNVSWQSEIIPSIAEALLDHKLNEKKGTWLLLQGNDEPAKRRIAQVAAESICGSENRLVYINSNQSSNTVAEIWIESLSKYPKSLFFIEFSDGMAGDFGRMLQDCMRNGNFMDPTVRKGSLDHAIFFIATNESSYAKENTEKVLNLRFSIEETLQNVCKRKVEVDDHSLQKESKRFRTCENNLDLNVCVEEEDDTDVPSDLTHESDTRDNNNNLPTYFMKLIGACFTLDFDEDRKRRRAEELSSKLHQAFKKACSGEEELQIDRTVIEELMKASVSFMEAHFEDWLERVFQTSLATVRNGRKVFKLEMCKVENFEKFGFLGTCLPNRISIM